MQKGWGQPPPILFEVGHGPKGACGSQDQKSQGHSSPEDIARVRDAACLTAQAWAIKFCRARLSWQSFENVSSKKPGSGGDCQEATQDHLKRVYSPETQMALALLTAKPTKSPRSYGTRCCEPLVESPKGLVLATRPGPRPPGAVPRHQRPPIAPTTAQSAASVSRQSTNRKCWEHDLTENPENGRGEG